MPTLGALEAPSEHRFWRCALEADEGYALADAEFNPWPNQYPSPYPLPAPAGLPNTRPAPPKAWRFACLGALKCPYNRFKEPFWPPASKTAVKSIGGGMPSCLLERPARL